MMLHQAAKELQEINRELTHQHNLKFLRDILKIFIIGFFIDGDIDKRISEFSSRKDVIIKDIDAYLSKYLASIEKRIEEIEKSDTYLIQSNEEKLIEKLKTFEKDLTYLKTVKAFGDKFVYEKLDLVDKYRHVIDNYNKEFIESEIENYKEFFDSLESYPLTYSQRGSIVVDEVNNLVVAGAGTGKTSMIVGKASYIIKKGLAKPEEILLIAFARDVRDEMDLRVYSRLGIRLNVKTFHSLGLSIIAESEGIKPSVSELSTDLLKLQQKIIEFIQSRMEDREFLELINEYFLFYYTPYESIFDFKSMGEYIEYIKNYDIRSLKGDKVKSYEECDIANFLYMNGIKYEYEADYEIKTATRRRRQYRPDFYLPDYGIYIEHFGIDREGNTAPYIPKRKYHEEMGWKRRIHNKNNTILIETYSYEKTEGPILKNLEEKLRRRGVKFNRIPRDKIFEEIKQLGLVAPFTALLTTFLNLYKSSGKTLDELTSLPEKLSDRRKRIFLDIFSKIYEDYTAYLEETGEIDFNDMINKAQEYVKQGKFILKFKYILVDEFQDISQSRYRLLKSLLDQNPSSKLFCVGDDWQSIYRFTGSDLSIMTDFQGHFGYSETMFLDKTFRFNDKLCDFATKFILKNPNQIKKELTTHSKADEPAVTLLRVKTLTLTDILNKIAETEKGTVNVFIIGRYNHLKPHRLYEIDVKYPKLSIEYLTAHRSKGTQADYVIIIGLTSGEYGFPCQIADDPILNLVLSKDDPFPNAEERRLFYVAVTRARNHVFLITDEHNPSPFISEIEREEYDINTIGGSGKIEISCPECKMGKIVERKGWYGEFYSCSNYPYCEYVAEKCPECYKGFLYRKEKAYLCTNDKCSFEADICPSCNDGYLVLRSGRYSKFYGCSNYPSCKYTKSLFKKYRDI